MDCAENALVGDNPIPYFGGNFDYRGDAAEVAGAIMEVMMGGTPDPLLMMNLFTKLAWKFPKMAMDGPIIVKTMFDNGCFDICVPDMDLNDFYN